jgi:hypothetical protein
MNDLNQSQKDFLRVHAVFALAALLILALPIGIVVGLRLCGLVVFYNILIPLVGWRRGHPEWVRLWTFLLPLSILQIFPDWFLAAELGTLVFPDTGSPMISPTPIYMAGLWVIPLFLTTYLGLWVQERSTRRNSMIVVSAASFLIFFGSEATLWQIPIWHAEGVTTIAHVAVYVIIPEIILGLTTFMAYDHTKTRSLWPRLSAAFLVMLIYMGGLSTFYLVFERIILGK